jgi:ribosomal protein L34E
MRLKLLAILCLVICNISVLAKNTALLIGIGKYNEAATGWSVIHGNNDAKLLSTKLTAKGFNVSTLIDKHATKKNIVSSLQQLVANANVGDVIYLHFSGHGQRIQDMNSDEDDDFDESFVCYDACFSPKYKIKGKAYVGQNHLIDDELFPILNQLKQKIGTNGELIVIFDSCYSDGTDRGEIQDDPEPNSEVEWVNSCRGSYIEFPVNKSVETYLRIIKKPSSYASTGGHVTVISACGSEQRNYECKEKRTSKSYGSLSYCVAKLLDRNISFSQWYDFFKNKQYVSLKIFRPFQRPVVERY